MALMEQVLKQEIKTIVIAHKNRLCRFGFDFAKWLEMRSEIVIVNNTYKQQHQELRKYLMSIMHCFSSKIYF